MSDKYVTVSPKHRKFEILFKFDDRESAEQFYKSFEIETKKLYKQRLKILFCMHERECYLDVGSTKYHYMYCPDCKIAVHVNDESEEDRNIRLSETMKNFDRYRIEKMKKDIAQRNDELTELKKEFKKKYLEEI